MSASSKKKLRKEQEVAAMTQRQKQEQKEAKKLKWNTIGFVAIIGLVLVAFLAIISWNWISNNGILEKNTTAATINGNEINSVEMNYYFVDTALEQANQLASYAEYFGGNISMMGLDTSKSLEDQFYDEENKITWADYIMDMAIESAQSDYAVAAAAKKAGYSLSDEDKATLDTYSKNLDANAKAYGYEDADQFLSMQYGSGSDKESYLAYLKRSMIASGYYTEYSDSLTYDEAAIREHDAKNPLNYNSYDYAHYYVTNDDYLEGGTEGEDGKVTYSDEEKKAAADKAKAVAEQLKTCESLEALEAAVAELEVGGKKEETVTHAHKTLYTSIDATYSEWIGNADRKEGDIEMFENKSAAAEGEEAEVVGYYIVVYEGMITNAENKMSNVRHLLVAFPEETEEESTETTGETETTGDDETPGDDVTAPTEATTEATEAVTEATTEATEAATTEATEAATTEATEAATEEVTEPTTEETKPVEGEDTETEGEDVETTGEETEGEEEAAVSETVKAETLKKAEDLLAQWQAGEATEDSFAALVKDNTDDEGSAETGGLYEDIHAGSNYVESFLNWATDAERKAGDVEIVETEYGYHIMYFVGWDEFSYRDQMIHDEMKNEELEAWYTGLTEAKPAKEGNTKYIKKDLILANFGL